MSKEVKKLIDEMNETLAEVKRKFQEQANTLVNDGIFKVIFQDNPGLKLVVIRGTTPSFNDGDECTHSQETVVGRWRKSSYSDFWFGDVEREEDEDLFEIDEENQKSINSDCTTLEEVSSLLKSMEDLFYEVYGTNWQLIVRLEDDGEVTIDHDYYDCGY